MAFVAREHLFCSIWTILLLIFSVAHCLSTQEESALRDLVSAMPALESLPSPWTVSNFSGVCSWTGITCDTIPDGSIVSLSISSRPQQVSGALPFSIGNLSSLNTLFLENNNISGTLPESIGNLTALSIFSLTNNCLVGPIPASLGQLSQLTELKLGSNRLTGPIPATLGQLSNLRTLELPLNQLSGQLPDELGNLASLISLDLRLNPLNSTIPETFSRLTNMTVLDLRSTQLYGSIPEPLWQLQKLQKVFLFSNSLSGTISSSIGNCFGLTELYAYSNSLSGTIPDSISQLANLEVLELQVNRLEGPIPDNLGSLSKLRRLVLDSNRLNSSVPASFGNLGELSYLRMVDNRFSGSLSPWLSNLTKLETVALHSNQFSGSIASLDKLFRLRQITLGSNQLTGGIPEGLWNNANLTLIAMQKNALNGTLSPRIGNLTGLSHLDFQTNSLSGAIPTELALLPDLKRLYLYNNDFSGAIPPKFGTVSSLIDFQVHNNRLNGSIPASLGNMTSLVTLFIFNNPFVGSNLPETFGNLENLEQLQAGFSGISGPIPASLVRLQRLRILFLDGNSFSGSIPTEIGNMTALEEFSVSANLLTGAIPASLSSARNLLSINFGKNSLQGTIPDLRNCTRLQRLIISENSLLNTTIPDHLGGLSNLEELQIAGSSLYGTVPSTLGNLTRLKILNLSRNRLEGTLPVELDQLPVLETFEFALNSLRGPLPVPLSMPNLRRYVFFSNSFSGSIPKEITRCTALTNLEVQNNLLNGTIPVGVSNLTRLVRLELDANQLAGSLPELTNLTSLQFLSFYLNQINGTIPESISASMRLEYIYGHKNRLSGTLPDGLFLIPTLKGISLSENSISGSIPTGISNCSLLEQFSLGLNRLTGAIPPLENLTRMIDFNVVSNGLTGTIPNLSASLQLLIFVTRDNPLEGPLPTFPFPLTKLERLDLCGNKITSPLGIWNMPVLSHLDLGFCNITGTIPTDFTVGLPALTEFLLPGNQLQGALPSLLPLPNLVNFNLSRNLFSGPVAIDSRTHDLVKFYDISHNTLQGDLPPPSTMPSLEVFDVSHNSFSGEVSAEHLLHPTLISFDASHNNITGSTPTIPAAIRNANSPPLQKLDLSWNQLNGTIGQFGQLNLSELYLNNNFLSGSMSESPLLTQHLGILDVSYNVLSGSLETICLLRQLREVRASNNLFSSVSIACTYITRAQLIDFSHNKLKGEFMSYVGPNYYRRLKKFTINNNELSGAFPSAFVFQSPILEYLDMSSNQLTGPIPENLTEIVSLSTVLLYNNLFSGCTSGLNFAVCNLSSNPFLCSCSPLCLVEARCDCGQSNQTCAAAAFPTGFLCSSSLECMSRACFDGKCAPATAPSTANAASPSGGVAVGVGVSVAILIAVALIIAVFLVLRRNKRRRQAPTDAVALEVPPVRRVAELAGSDLVMMQKLGEGSDGIVSLAMYRGEFVAVKTLRGNNADTQLQRITQEADIMNSIKENRNVVKLIGVVQDGEASCIVMEFCPRGSLSSFIAQAESLSEYQIFSFSYGICSGMVGLAASGIIHGDLRSDNVLLQENLLPKVSDFGVSRNQDCHPLSGDDSVLGPVKWQAPEVLKSGIHSEKSDVWAFGCTIIHIATKKEPYFGFQGTLIDILVAIRDKGLNPLSHLKSSSEFSKIEQHRWIIPLLEGCFREDPSARPTFRECRYLLSKSARPLLNQYEDELDKADSLLHQMSSASASSPTSTSTWKPAVALEMMKSGTDMILPSPNAAGKIDLAGIQILGDLGQGAFGRVRLGFSNGIYVAVKEIPSTRSMDEAIHELSVMLSLQAHRNIVSLFGAVSSAGSLSIVMEFAPRGDLESVVKASRSSELEYKITEGLLFKWTIGIARGMQALSASGVVHRDLAIRNILLDSALEPKVSDFGLSRAVIDASQESSTKTDVGPIRWFAPECFDLKYSEKSDIWAYGCCLIELATAAVPWKHLKLLEVPEAVLSGRTPLEGIESTNVPPWMFQTMQKCFHSEAANRASFAEIVARLEESALSIYEIRKAEDQIKKRRERRAGTLHEGSKTVRHVGQ